MNADCLICAHVKVHGTWPRDHGGTHCRNCHRSWTALGEVHCAGCCEHFTGYPAFDMHLSGVEVVEHRHPATVKRLERTDRPGGPVWRIRLSDSERQRLAALGNRQNDRIGVRVGQISPAKAEVA